MSFFSVPSKRASASGSTPMISEVRAQITGRVITIRISRDIVEHLGWKLGDRFDLLFGDGRDTGSALLRRAPNGPISFPAGKAAAKPESRSAIHFSCQRLPAFLPRVNRRTESLKYRFDAGGLVFDIPRTWFSAPVPERASPAASFESRGEPR